MSSSDRDFFCFALDCFHGTFQIPERQPKKHWPFNIWQEKLFMAFTTLIFVVILTTICRVWASSVNYHQEGIKIGDAGFVMVPHYSDQYADYLIDFLVVFSITLGVARVLMEKKRMSLIRMIVWCLNIVYIIRCFTIVMTVFPNPYGECVWDLNMKNKDLIEKHTELWLFLWDIWDVLVSGKRTCGDVMFSGHTTSVVAGILCWLFTENQLHTRLLVSSQGIISLFMIISTRFHYTDDVIIGTAITVLVFLTYYLMRERKIETFKKYQRVYTLDYLRKCYLLIDRHHHYSNENSTSSSLYSNKNKADTLVHEIPVIHKEKIDCTIVDSFFLYLDGPAGEYEDDYIEEYSKIFTKWSTATGFSFVV